MATSKTALVNVALSKLGTVLLNHIDQLNSKEAETARAHYDTVLSETLREHPWTFARKTTRLSLAYPTDYGDITVTVPGYDEAVLEYDAGDDAYYDAGVSGGLTLVQDTVTTQTGSTATRWCIKDDTDILYISSTTADHPAAVMRWLNYDGSYTETDIQFYWPELEGWKYAYAVPSGCVVLRGTMNRSGSTVLEFMRAMAFGSQVILSDTPDMVATYTALVTDTTMFDPLFERAMTCLLASRMSRRITGSDAMENSMLQAYDVALADARFRDAQVDNSAENRTSFEQMLQADFLTNRDEY